jgi:hypothetical protein
MILRKAVHQTKRSKERVKTRDSLREEKVNHWCTFENKKTPVARGLFKKSDSRRGPSGNVAGPGSLPVSDPSKKNLTPLKKFFKGGH